MLTFGFATMISVKNLKAIKRDLCRFSMTLKTVIFFSCPNSKGNILQKTLTYFWDNWKSQFEGLFPQCSQLTVKGNVRAIEKVAMF